MPRKDTVASSVYIEIMWHLVELLSAVISVNICEESSHSGLQSTVDVAVMPSDPMTNQKTEAAFLKISAGH